MRSERVVLLAVPIGMNDKARVFASELVIEKRSVTLLSL